MNGEKSSQPVVGLEILTRWAGRKGKATYKMNSATQTYEARASAS
jgi:hypothetical protein